MSTQRQRGRLASRIQKLCGASRGVISFGFRGMRRAQKNTLSCLVEIVEGFQWYRVKVDAGCVEAGGLGWLRLIATSSRLPISADPSQTHSSFPAAARPI